MPKKMGMIYNTVNEYYFINEKGRESKSLTN